MTKPNSKAAPLLNLEAARFELQTPAAAAAISSEPAPISADSRSPFCPVRGWSHDLSRPITLKPVTRSQVKWYLRLVDRLTIYIRYWPTNHPELWLRASRGTRGVFKSSIHWL
jgi:hypothetical protein